MQVDLTTFDTRAARTRYVAEHFRGHLTGRVLDVGCDQSPLRELVPDIDYTGTDVGGNADVLLDFEKVERLPFDDNQFDSVICCDVLEHLDNLHFIFGELVRVTKSNLIISLPNCWAAARQPVGRGRGYFGHYGLPFDRPADRHKWFFSLTDAVDFLEEHAMRNGLLVSEIRVAEKKRPAIKQFLRRLRYSSQFRYLNRYAHTVFVVLEKQ